MFGRRRATPPMETLAGRTVVGLTPDGTLRAGRLAGLSLRRAIWVLSWPILIESLLNSFVGLTDTVLAAALWNGDAATDAIGGASYIVWFIGLVIMSLGIGATALVSRSVGAGRLAVANAALAQTLMLAVVLGVAVGLLVAGLAGPVASLMKMPDDRATMFTHYLWIVSAGVPLTAILFAGIACARGAGDSVRPLYAMVAVNVVNILASWAFSGVDLARTRMVDGELVRQVFLSNPFGFDLGVKGIAIGTVLAHAVGASIIIMMAVRGTWGIRLVRHRLRPHWHTIRRLVRVGLPNLSETFGLWVGNFMIVIMVGWLGAEGMLGSHIVAIRIEAFSFLPGFAMGAAAATLAGQYLGAGSPAMARRAVLYCVLIASVVMGGMGLLLAMMPREITGLLTSQEVHLEHVPPLLIICGVVQIPFAIAIVTRSAMRGAGDVKMVMLLTWVTTYGVRLPLAYALSGVDLKLAENLVLENPFRDEPSLSWLWVAMCAELVVRGAVFGARFMWGGWTKARV
ncbi:MAG: MATE family efflux transporter [Planctomycetes bacterium]|nr:MATE family efflux transporter [Planctomycetota bacterium]